MPSIARSKKWFVRVTVPHEFAKSMTTRMLEWIDLGSILVATHKGNKDENPHVHMVITLTSELQKQSFDARIKKLYGVSGNGQYSSKQWDGDDGACSYLFHEADAEIICNRGYTEQDIERFKKLNDDVQKVVAVNKERASHTHVEKVLEKIQLSGGNWFPRQIFDEFIQRIYNREMHDPGDWTLRKYIEEVYIRQYSTYEELRETAYGTDRFNRLYRI